MGESLETGRRVIRLKTWPGPFAATRAGLKPWELRKNDRGYRVGDLLVQEEWDPATEAYTGKTTGGIVTFILEGGQFGLPADHVIMTLDLGALSLASPTKTGEGKNND